MWRNSLQDFIDYRIIRIDLDFIKMLGKKKKIEENKS